MTWQAFRLRTLWCWHQLLTLGLAALVVVAAFIGLSRQLLPLADRYRPEVEAVLSTRLGVPVTLQRLEGEADGAQMKLRLVQLDLHDPAAPGTVLLRIPEVELRPAVWQSLRHGEMRLDIRLSGLDIHLDQQPDGRLQLRELSGLARRNTGSAEAILRRVLRQPVLALSRSRVELSLKNMPSLTLNELDVVNRNEGDQHRLAGHARLSGSREEIALQIELDGDPLQWQQGRLRLWARLPVLSLDGLLPALGDKGQGIERLTGGGSYWLDFQSGRLTAVQARIDWRELVLQRPEGRRHFRNMRGLLSWQRQGEAWQLATQHMQGRVDDLPWPLPQVAVRSAPGALSVALAQGNIAGLDRLLPVLPVPSAAADWIRQATPTGELAKLRADLRARPDGGWQLQRLDVEGRRLSARAVARHPGGRNLAGWLRWTPERAWLGLAGQNARLELPALFEEPVTVHRLKGHLRLVREADVWRLDSDHLQLTNMDFEARAVLSLAAQTGAAPRLSLLGNLTNARAASAWRYIPRATGGRVAEWLHHSLRGGTVAHGDFAYEGPLRSIPDQDPARLLMRFALQQGQLDYAPGWPGVRDLDSVVILDGHRLEIVGDRASLLDGTQARELRATIADFREPVLELAADLTSNGADLARLFQESPLRRHTPGLTETLTLEGAVNGRLSIAMPLRGGNPQVAATVQLRDNSLLIRPAKLTASALRGELRYSTEEGLQASRLDARLLEAPVRADIQTQPGAQSEVLVNLTGTASVPALRRWLASSLLDIASGTTDYHARVTIPTGADPRLQIDSSLTGLRMKLPSPLGKSAQESVPLRYHTSLGGKEQLARLQYGQRLSAGLVWKDNRLDRALLRLDSNTVAWPELPGLEIEGRLPRLNLADWKPWLGRFQRPARASTVAARGETSLPALTRLQLETRELLAEGWRLDNARLALARSGEGWQLAVDSEQLAGVALLPDAPGREISLSFSRLLWPLPAVAAKAESGAGLNPVAGLGNRPLSLQGEGLRLGAWPALGQLGISARLLPIPHGLRIENISLQGPLLGFSGKLDWQWRGGAYTRLQGKASSANVAALLAAFGQAPGLLSQRATADFDLSWPGAPDRAALASLDGQLKVKLEKGRLLNVGTGANVSRVFGWFDLDNLQRRFKGDFSDVARRGLAFDSIVLDGALQSGVMQPATLAVTGPTLQAKGRGRLDLGQRKLDQQFTVTMPMTSAVPIAAVVMAGPVVGGAVAAAQMAFDKQIDKATQLHYRVSGDWASPRVERLTVKAVPQTPVRNVAGTPAMGMTTKEDE